MLFDDVAELGNDRRHELTTRLPIATARIEDSLEFVDQERHVTALAEDRRDDARQCDDPLIVIEILRIDENLERPALLELGAFVQDDVVDRHVHRMIGDRCLDLIRRADEHLRALQLLVHADDIGAIAATAFAAILGFLRFLFGTGLIDGIADDFFADLDHCSIPLTRPDGDYRQNLP